MAVTQGAGGGGRALRRVPTLTPGLGDPLTNFGQIPQPSRGRAADALRLTAQAAALGFVPTRNTFSLTTPSSTTVPTSDFGGGGGGAGGGGGGGAEVPTGPTVADILKNIAFPAREELPPYLRDFGKFIQDLIVSSSTASIPIPKIEEGKLVTEGATVATQEIPQDAEAYAAMWQSFLDMVKAASFGLQQQLVGLNFNPQTGFFIGANRPILPNPSFL